MSDFNDSTTLATEAPAKPLAANYFFVFMALRLFMGFRLLLSGLEKLGFLRKVGTPGEAFKNISWEYWYGPKDGFTEAAIFGSGYMSKIAGVMKTWTNLPDILIKGFVIPLPIFMIGCGALILLGLANRLAWGACALLWFSLAFGQMLLPDEPTIQQLFMYVIASALALCLIDHNRLRITKW